MKEKEKEKESYQQLQLEQSLPCVWARLAMQDDSADADAAGGTALKLEKKVPRFWATASK